MTAVNPQVARILANTALTPEQKREQIRQVHKPKIELTRKVPATHIDTMLAEGGVTPAQAYQLKQQSGTPQGDAALAQAMAAQTDDAGTPMMLKRAPSSGDELIDQAAAAYGIDADAAEALKIAPPEEQKRVLDSYARGVPAEAKKSQIVGKVGDPDPAEGTIYAADPRAGASGRPAQIRNPAAGAAAKIAGQRRKFAKDMEGYQREIDEASNRQIDAVAKLGEVKAEAAKEQLRIAEQAQADQRDLEAERARNENKRKEALAAAEAELNDVITDFRSKRIDPTRLYSKRRRVQVANAIGTAFGALAQGKFAAAGIAMGNPVEATARRNVEMIEKQIDQDIAAQRSEIEKLRSVAGMKQNGLQMMRQRFGDERAAESALRVAMLDDVQNRLKTMAARYGGQESDAATMQAIGQLEEKKAAKAMELAGYVDERTQRSLAMEADARAKGQAAQAKMMSAVGAGGPSAKMSLPPTLEWIDPSKATPKRVEEAQKLELQALPVLDGMKHMIAWRKEYGVEKIPTEALVEGQQLLDALRTSLWEYSQAGGALTDNEERLVMLGLPEDAGEMGRQLARYEKALKSIERKRRVKMRALWARPKSVAADRGGAPVN